MIIRATCLHHQKPSMLIAFCVDPSSCQPNIVAHSAERKTSMIAVSARDVVRSYTLETHRVLRIKDRRIRDATSVR